MRPASTALLLAFLAGACAPESPRVQEKRSVRLATSTALPASGILGELVSAFERKHPDIEVRIEVLGSGKALQEGGRGNADLLVTHSPLAERRFLLRGDGVNRRLLMRNAYVVVGPRADPASLRGTPDILEALRRIRESRARFVSRGDDGATHRREAALWRAAGGPPEHGGYDETPRPMSEALVAAARTGAYTLVDRASFALREATGDLKVLCAGDTRLVNEFSLIVPNPLRFPSTEYEGAMRFLDFSTAPAAQRLIACFGEGSEHGPLYVPERSPR